MLHFSLANMLCYYFVFDHNFDQFRKILKENMEYFQFLAFFSNALQKIINANKQTICNYGLLYHQIILNRIQNRNMEILEPSSPSFETISIKLTQNFIPSSTNLPRVSQDYVSLTYTVSFQQINDHQSSEYQLNENNYFHNRQITIDHQLTNLNCNTPKIKKQQINENVYCIQKDHEKKQNIKLNKVKVSPQIKKMKINNLGTTPQNVKAKNIFQISNHSGSIVKSRGISEHISIKRLQKSKSKQKEQQSPQYLLLKTNKFCQLKNDKIKQTFADQKKKNYSIKKQLLKSVSTQRNKKLPHLKFPVYNNLTFRKRNMSHHLNVLNQKQVNLCNQKLQDALQNKLIGKTCKIMENDKKAKIYLQKIIQNRCSVIHLNQQKLKSTFNQ